MARYIRVQLEGFDFLHIAQVGYYELNSLCIINCTLNNYQNRNYRTLGDDEKKLNRSQGVGTARPDGNPTPDIVQIPRVVL